MSYSMSMSRQVTQVCEGQREMAPINFMNCLSVVKTFLEMVALYPTRVS